MLLKRRLYRYQSQEMFLFRVRSTAVGAAAGQIIREAALANTRPALAQLLVDFPRATVALAAGTHRPWISRYLTGLGATVLVANPRKLHAISRSERKCDPAMPRGSPVSPGWILSCSIPSSTAPPRPSMICWGLNCAPPWCARASTSSTPSVSPSRASAIPSAIRRVNHSTRPCWPTFPPIVSRWFNRCSPSWPR